MTSADTARDPLYPNTLGGGANLESGVVEQGSGVLSEATLVGDGESEQGHGVV